MPYQKTKEGRLVNEITLGDGYPLSNDLQPLKIGGEASVIEISHPLPDGSDNGLFKVNGDLDITGTLKTKLSHDLIYDFDDEVNTLAQAKVDALIDSAPAALDTLNELAAALGDDANFATTVTNSLALKAPLAAPAFTGDATFDSTTLTIDSSNNRVGIGTASPSRELHIYRNNIYAAVEIQGSSKSLYMGGNWGIGYTTSTDLEFKINNSTQMIIDSGARVGIGTTSPSVKLDVEESSVSALIDIHQSASGTGTDSGIRFQKNSNLKGTVGYNAGTDTVNLNYGAFDNTHLNIDSSGNVGIGTASPNSLLELYGNNEELRFQSTGSQFSFIKHQTSDHKLRLTGWTGVKVNPSSASGKGLEIEGQSGQSADLFHISSYNQDGDLMTVDSSGNVGIGTTSPSNPLEVVAGENKGICVNRNATTTDSPVEVGFRHTTSDGDATTGMRSYRTNEDDSNDQELRFFTMSGSSGEGEHLTIKHNGNVGIGTTSPDTLLHLASSSGDVQLKIEADTDNDNELDNPQVLFAQDGGAVTGGIGLDGSNNMRIENIWSNDAADVVFHASNAEKMRITGTGSVGIGTTSPSTKLHVAGSFKATGVADFDDRVDINETSFPQLTFSDDGGTDKMNMGQSGEIFYFKTSDTANDIRFRRSDNTDVLNFDMSNARVGIGTTSPTTTLDVEGTVSYKHTAFSTAGPTDNIDVSDTTVLEVDTSSNNVIIGGFTGGVQGQILYIVKTNTANFIQLEHNEGGGSQDIFITTGADERVVGYGGYTLYCNGTSWFSLSNPTGGADAG